MAKYIDADLLRKEIEKYKNMIDVLFTEGDDSVYDGENDAYNRMLRIIDSLQQEHVPENEKTGTCEDASEYIRTIKSLIADFIRDKQPGDVDYYQKIYDWLDKQ